MGVEVGADLGGDGEAGRHRQAEIGHFGEVRALAAEQIAHVGLALGLAVAEGVDPFAFGTTVGRRGARFGFFVQAASHGLLLRLGADGASFFDSHGCKQCWRAGLRPLQAPLVPSSASPLLRSADESKADACRPGSDRPRR